MKQRVSEMERAFLQLVKKSSSPKEAAQKLVNEANKNGGKDNISVVIAEY